MPVGRKHIPAKDYADETSDAYDQTVRFVRSWLFNVKEQPEIDQSKSRKTAVLDVGDFVLMLRPEYAADRPGVISKKLLRLTFDVAYQIHHKLNEQSIVVRSAGTQEEPVGFSNPVNLGRLIRAHTWTVREPEGASEKRLEVLQEDEVTWSAAKVIGNGFDTSVQVQYDGSEDKVWVDLAKEQYRWVI